jgi:hypothetical protein
LHRKDSALSQADIFHGEKRFRIDGMDDPGNLSQILAFDHGIEQFHRTTGSFAIDRSYAIARLAQGVGYFITSLGKDLVTYAISLFFSISTVGDWGFTP